MKKNGKRVYSLSRDEMESWQKMIVFSKGLIKDHLVLIDSEIMALDKTYKVFENYVFADGIPLIVRLVPLPGRSKRSEEVAESYLGGITSFLIGGFTNIIRNEFILYRKQLKKYISAGDYFNDERCAMIVDNFFEISEAFWVAIERKNETQAHRNKYKDNLLKQLKEIKKKEKCSLRIALCKLEEKHPGKIYEVIKKFNLVVLEEDVEEHIQLERNGKLKGIYFNDEKLEKSIRILEDHIQTDFSRFKPNNN